MRRIFACMLVLGIAGLGGMGVMRGIAQTETPVLTPDQLKPANYANPKSSVMQVSEPGPRPDVKAPEIIDPLVPSLPETLPVLAPTSPMPAMLPPSNEKAVAPPEVPMPPMVEPAKTPAGSADAAVKPDTSSNPRPSALERIRPETPAPLPSTGNRVAPMVSIETVAPEQVQFGLPVTYEIIVRNTGSVAATQVRVDEELSAGTKFVVAEPAGDIVGDRASWSIGAMNIGEEKHIKVTVKPGEGDLATKPRVTCAAGTMNTVRITRPNLVMNITAPDAVQVGDEVPVKIQVSNSGNGDAAKVLLKAVLTDGLKHPEGNDIQALLSKLGPGESQTVTLRIQAAMPGAQTCTLLTTTDGAPKAAATVKFDILQPKLNLAVIGPTKCVVKAEPTFTVEVSNPGTSATEPVQLAVAFPEGLDVGTASDGGAFDLATRTVTWNLGPAAAGTKRNVTVKTKTTVAGHLAVRGVAQAGAKLNARSEAVIQAEGVPALLFEVVDSEDPIEVGKETTYEIRITNTGTMQCTNVRLLAALTDGLVPGQISSNVPHKVVGQTLVFDPIGKLAVKGDFVVRVRAKGTTPGDHRFKVQLSCDQMKQPVVKEESTSFFQQ